MLTTFLAAGINFVLNIILIKAMGIQGAVIATAFAYLVVFVFRMVDSQKYINFQINFVQISISVLILTVQCLVTIADWHSFIISGACIVALLIINYKTLKALLKKVIGKISR